MIIANSASGPHYSFFLSFTQNEYANRDHSDFRYSFGTIDRIDCEVDWVLKTVKLWFMDIYEWHPVCPPYYSKFPDDVVRETNSLHAALVELKDSGAADYWMVGEATMSLSDFGLP